MFYNEYVWDVDNFCFGIWLIVLGNCVVIGNLFIYVECKKNSLKNIVVCIVEIDINFVWIGFCDSLLYVLFFLIYVCVKI